jgi:hypothetical protein
MLKSRLLASFLLLASLVAAQSQPKPLTNEDVVAMFKAGLPASTITAAVQSEENTFDLSAAGLIALKKNGVSQQVMDAMIAASAKKKEAAAAPATAPAPAAAMAALPAMPAMPSTPQPTVFIVQGASKTAIPLSKTQISQTKTKPASLGALATDPVLGQAFQGLAVQAGTMAALHSGSAMGAGMIGSAGGLVSGFMSHKKPTITEVWALAGQKADSVASNQPAFEVNFANIPGVNPDEYEPVLIKLAPSANNFRLVGATQAKQDVLDSSAMDWQVYSSFVEERMAVQSQKSERGQYKLQSSSPLGAGEYGIALRPLNKDKKFSGSSVAQNSGDGLMFNSVWAFSVR